MAERVDSIATGFLDHLVEDSRLTWCFLEQNIMHCSMCNICILYKHKDVISLHNLHRHLP